jgi:RNA polymerase subunit RPABC4/transcription elongation factor Spt4
LAAIFLFLYFSFFIKDRTSREVSPSGAGGAALIPEGKSGDARTCPVCAARLPQGDNVKSKILPPSGRDYRVLHISGCKFCLGGDRRRLCPVCGAELSRNEYLAARIWQRLERPEVRIQGCVHCIGGGKRGVKVKKLR